MWPDNSGNNRHSSGIRGSIAQSFFGSSKTEKYIYGSSTSGITLGTTIPTGFTICSISSYTSSHRGRILDAKYPGKWIHGHYRGVAGVAHYEHWVTSSASVLDPLQWVVVCGKSTKVTANDIDRTIRTSGQAAPSSYLTVNQGRGFGANQRSDWAVAKVSVWNRQLDDTEMSQASQILLNAIKVCLFCVVFVFVYCGEMVLQL